MLNFSFYAKYKISKEIEQLEKEVERLKKWKINIKTDISDWEDFISDDFQKILEVHIENELYKQRDIHIQKLQSKINELNNSLD
jgi:predicted  nucleic acid-binding Zn-ribbon protein